MKNLLMLFFITAILSFSHTALSQSIPYSTNENYLTIWNGTHYIPFFIKGTNLGVAVPGTFPGELAATKSDYQRWFSQIKEAGFNCIRLYTLHYPRFYETLHEYNQANSQNPLLFIQGVWLNEELDGYQNDLYFMTDTFSIEIKENIDCVHGNCFIAERQGKAYGHYKVDVSPWCLAYIIGREVHPGEILTTNKNQPSITHFTGTHFAIKNATASEVWFTSALNTLVEYENKHYNTQRPVSASSWPTLDPLSHPEEANSYEDTASLDLSKITINKAPAGLFISYHAYPYYPDFISLQSDYQVYADDNGPNSYKGYLTELKSHYPKYPLIIAEFGVPSSWGVAHYASSGMNHGGFDEYEQGNLNMRLFHTIKNTSCGGGIHFAWIDEWFKRTWITDPIDYIPESRILWHNIAAAEQNFGLISYKEDSKLQSIALFDTNSVIPEIKANANYTFFELEIALKNPLNTPDELYIALDTYADELGESLLPNKVSIPVRSEFILHLTNYSANLYATEAYDTYGIWHNISEPEQLYRSISSDGAPWYIARWKNNSGKSDVQYVGSLQVNYSFQNPSSKDGVTIFDDKIRIKIPWSLINFIAPNQLKVLHDDRLTPTKEDTITAGINLGVYYQNEWHLSNQRFSWSGWNTIESSKLKEFFKTSYHIMKQQLVHFNTPAIALRDSFYFDNETFPITISKTDGVLLNDFDLDGDEITAIITETPANGNINLNNDGSFTYSPTSYYNGTDSIMYCLFDGYNLSEANTVIFEVAGNTQETNDIDSKHVIVAFPNPTKSNVTIKTAIIFDDLSIFNAQGQRVLQLDFGKTEYHLDLSDLNNGLYVIVGKSSGVYHSSKFIKE